MDTASSTPVTRAWRLGARQLTNSEFVTPALLLAPSILLLLVVIAYPMAQGLFFSFTDGSLMKAGDFVGFDNYIKLLNTPAFYHSLRFSAIFAVCNIAGCYLLGLGLALLLQQDLPGRGMFRVLLLLPWIVPSLVSIVSWRWMVKDENALFNQVITLFGGSPIFFLSDSTWAVVIVILIKIWRSFPFMMLSLLAALQSIDRSLYEAAAIDGATRWQSFWNVTLPQIKNISVVLCLLMTIWSVNDFDTPWLLAQGGPANATENLVVLAYRYTFARNDVGMGAATSFVTLSVLMALVFFLLRLQRRS
ncbi:carbohydrate ABC transporter permease [Rhizobium ruizarguesonis]|uniref:carbohydrate ABC transporter permease n=1 Tax=Rhizobium ruizarguesonis TaxID=2081791 RepID=UPI0013BFFF7D|nr:sugar ABC transporter permease [Rhizobium ruizarguesonis]NEI96489.1 ABC transporter permease subunit [Rhizobium ruizarguesonis]NEJ33888.1 ABC transporter permease subunit [Rhizobium ruizarguesonis]